MSEAMSVADTVALARRWRDLGGTHFGIRSMGFGFKTADQHIAHFAEVRRRLY